MEAGEKRIFPNEKLFSGCEISSFFRMKWKNYEFFS